MDQEVFFTLLLDGTFFNNNFSKIIQGSLFKKSDMFKGLIFTSECKFCTDPNKNTNKVQVNLLS